MIITFESNLNPTSLQEYAEKIGWDDCSSLNNDGTFDYVTESGSAVLIVESDGSGKYHGQRSLLFSHAVFSKLTKAWLADKLEVIDVYSRDKNIPPFIYFGDCYMKNLRMDALKKGIDSEIFEGMKKILEGRDDINYSLYDPSFFDGITKALKMIYLRSINPA